jgi:hypothetical protein
MPGDGIEQILVTVWIAALSILLLRMLMLRLHQTYLLFTISTGLDLIFAAAILKNGLVSKGSASLALLGDTMDIFLTPSVALELFSVSGGLAAYPFRVLSPVLLMLFAGAGINLFLADNPDTDALQAALELAHIADLMITIFVISFVIRKLRQQDSTLDRNTLWLRRLFFIELISSAIQSMAAPFVDAQYYGVVESAFLSISVLATAICTISLRKIPVGSESV